MNHPFYVYRHIRNDTGSVFYVGKGSQRPGRKVSFARAHCRERKNPVWCHIVEKHGYTVEIMALCQTEDEALSKEAFFVTLYGRKCEGGTLVNVTAGGRGRPGIQWSTEDRQKLRARMIGRVLPAETGRKISAAKKGIATSIQKGDKLPEWWKDRIRQTKFGPRNPMYGRTGAASKQARKVINAATGEVFDSVTLAAASVGMPLKSLYNCLTGFRVNRTPLQFHAS